MGIFRKTMSIGTLGAIDFRSDKERVARYSRQTRNAVRAQSKMQAKLAEEQVIAAHRQATYAQQQAQISAAQLAVTQNPAPLPTTRPPAGWYPDQQDTSQMRWWDGFCWTEQRRPRQLPS